MTLEMWYALAILIVAVILFVTEWIRLDIVAIGVMVALLLTGLLNTQEAFSGFSNSSVITITALFVVGGAVMQTGLAGLIGRRILLIAGTSETRLMIVIMVAVAILSGFMSNTGTVAVLLPAIISLAWSAKVSPSKLLIPLSFGASLGGAMTLIGTPPNIIVSEILEKAGMEPFGFFSFAPVGLMLLVTGTLFMVFVGKKLLPDHKTKQDLQRIESPDELFNLYRLPESLFRLRIRRGSELVDKTIATSKLRSDFNVTVVELLRPAQPRSVVKVGDQRLVWQTEGVETISPKPDTLLHLDDVLIVQGAAGDVSHAAASFNLGIQQVELADQDVLISEELGIAEIVLPPRSSMVDKTIVETRFGSSNKLTVLGINRPGATEKLDIKNTVLEFGDTLLVQGAWQNIMALRKKRHDFIVLGQPEAMIGAPNKAKAPIAMLIMAGMLVIMVTEVVPTTTASVLGALAVVLTGCLTIDEAYESVNWKSVVLIAGMLPMAIALEKVGLINLVAEGITNNLGAYGPLAAMAGLFLLTSAFTQVISNTATTVLLAPIAFVAAQNLNVNPHAFLMTVAIAASMAFATPVASPTNTLVMSAGNYRFSDYIKVGLPLIFVMLIVTLIGVPLVFPM